MKSWRVAAVLVLGLLLAPGAPALNETVAGTKPLYSLIEPDRMESVTGGRITFTTIVENTGPPTPGLTMFLTVLDARTGVPVDLRGWSDGRTRDVPALDAGMRYYDANGTFLGFPHEAPDDHIAVEDTQRARQEWTLNTPIAGQFIVYAIAIERDGDPEAVRVMPFSTPPMHLDVEFRPDVNPQGVLPVLLGVPAAVAFLAVALRRL